MTDMVTASQGMPLPTRAARTLLLFAVAWPRLVVAIVACAVGISLLFVQRIRIRLDARALIPEGEQVVAASDSAAALFGIRDKVVVGLVPDDAHIYTPHTLARLARLTSAVADAPGVIPSSVTSLATVSALRVAADTMHVESLLDLNGSLDSAKALRVRDEVTALGLNDGVLAARDGRAAAIYADVEKWADRQATLAAVRALAAREQSGDDSIYIGGTAVAQAALGRAAATDLLRLVPLVFIVLFGSLVLAYRNAVPAVLSVAEIAASIVITAGIMGLTQQPLFVTTLVLPVVVIVIGVSDDIYVLDVCRSHARDANEAMAPLIVGSFGSVARSIAITSGATVGGLLSLATSSLAPLRTFGLFGALAVAISTVLTFTLVPALAVLSRGRSAQFLGDRTKRYAQLTRLCLVTPVSGRWRLAGIAAGACACAVLLIAMLQVNDSWLGNLPARSDVVQSDRMLNAHLAGTTTIDFVVESRGPNDFRSPAQLAYLTALAGAVREAPAVGATMGVHSDVIRVIAALRQANVRALDDSLQRGRTVLTGLDVELAFALLALYREGGASNVDSSFRRARLTAFIHSADYATIHEVLEFAAALPSTTDGPRIVTPFGDGWVSYLAVGQIVDSQLRSIVVALVVDLLLVGILLKSLRSALAAIVPVALSVLVVFTILAAAGIPLGIAASMFAAITLGMGVDYAVHLTTAYDDALRVTRDSTDAMKHALDTAAPPMLRAVCIIAAGFSVLLLSHVEPNALLGLLLALSLLVCAGMSLLLIPSLTTVLRPSC